MSGLKDLLARKKRTGDWNVGMGEIKGDDVTEIRKVETYKAELDAAMNRVNQLTGAGFCYARALDTAAAEYNLPVEDLEQHIEYYGIPADDK